MPWFKSPEWGEILEALNDWWSEANDHVYNPGDSPPSKRFGLVTWELAEWCTKQTNIDPSPLTELYRKIESLNPKGVPIHGGPSGTYYAPPLWAGPPATQAELDDLAGRAMFAVDAMFQAGTQATPPVVRNSRMEARDQWLYEKALSGLSYLEIADDLKAIAAANRWTQLDEDGVRKAVQRYIKRRGLPPLGLQPGRKSKPK